MIEGVGKNPQEGRALRLQYCPELGSVPIDNMFMVYPLQSCSSSERQLQKMC